MTLSRWRRLATGVAAGVLVLCAAILGAQFRSDSNDVSVASELRPTDVIPIPEGDDEGEASGEDVVTGDVEDEADDEEISPIDDAEVDAADAEDADAEDADAEDAEVDAADGDETSGADDGDSEDPEAGEPVRVIEVDDLPDAGGTESNDSDSSDTESNDTAGAASSNDTTDETADQTEDQAAAEETSGDTAADSAAAENEAAAPPAPPAPTPTPPPAPAAPAPANPTGETLGTGGGVNDAECGIDRLVIYAGAPVGGVAGRLRTALAQNGFGAGCAPPVTVLAANCPQQFSGVLRSPGYDPSRPYVAASANLDRNAMISIVGATGYTGSTIDILDFGFVNADRPGEQWIAIFVPPSFAGWEGLASQAGLAPTSSSLCGPSGELGR